MKKINYILVFSVLSLQLAAQTVDMATVQNVARNIHFLQSSETQFTGIKRVIPLRGEDAAELLYIAEYPEGGFAIISGDRRAPAVLGYTERGSYDPDDMPPGLLFLIELYKAEIEDLRDFDIQPDEEVIDEWTLLSSSDLPPALRSSRYTVGEWLLTTEWSQKAGLYGSNGAFNKYTPDNDMAGCTAVAMAQILRYWNCRIKPTGSRSYKDSGRDVSADFENTPYQWAKMHDKEANDHNALLIYHAGVSCKTNYGKNGSSSTPGRARDGFVDYWGIKNSADVKWRIWNLRNWKDMLKAEIDAGRPVLYNGGATLRFAGHSWVIDGYNNKGEFHCNWGWRFGAGNGWFSIGGFKVTVEGKTRRYNDFQSAIFGVEPKEPVGVGTPQIKTGNSFSFNAAGHTLSVEPVYGATRYEWTTDNGRIESTGTSATLYASGLVTVSVRAYNALCDIYSPYSPKRIYINGPNIHRNSTNESGVTEYYIHSMIPGTTVTWSLTNTVDFEFVGAAIGERVRVRNKNSETRGTLKAHIQLQGHNDIYLEETIISGSLEIIGASAVNCQTTSYSASVVFPDTEYISWTTSPNIEIVLGQGTNSVKVRGTSNGQESWIQLELSQNGQVYTTRKNIEVSIPQSFSMSVVHTWMENGQCKALIQAIPYPYMEYDYFAYRWRISQGGSIKPCASPAATIPISDRELVDIMDAVGSSSNRILKEDVGENVFDQIETITNLPDFQLKAVAIVESFSMSNPGSVLLEVSSVETMENENTETEYVLLQQAASAIVPLPPIDDPLPWIPEDAPSYAVATFPAATDVTVTCTFTLPCSQTFTGTVFISGHTYTFSYNTSNRSIYVSRQGDEQFFNDGSERTYRIKLYNDFGLVETQNFSSAQKTIVVPLAGLPSGTYYVNIVNEQGVVIESQAVPAY